MRFDEIVQVVKNHIPDKNFTVCIDKWNKTINFEINDKELGNSYAECGYLDVTTGEIKISALSIPEARLKASLCSIKQPLVLDKCESKAIDEEVKRMRKRAIELTK